MLKLGAADALLEVTLALREVLVELLEAVKGGFKGPDIGFWVECYM